MVALELLAHLDTYGFTEAMRMMKMSVLNPKFIFVR